MSILKMEGIRFEQQGHRILKIDELHVEKGQVIGIMGPNGAGKSTLLNIFSLLQQPTVGAVYYQGEKVDMDNIPVELRRKFAIVMQQSLLFNTTVFQNVATGLKWRGMKRRQVKKQVEYWLARFRILSLSSRHASKLSGGEAQRVNLARAMALEPEILFLDEPFSALDFPAKIELIQELKEIIEETGITTIFISHDIQEIKFLTEFLWIVMDGEVKQQGDTKSVIGNPNSSVSPFLNKLKEFYL